MDQEFPAIVWVSGFVFLVVAVWLADFGQRSEMTRRFGFPGFAAALILCGLLYPADPSQGFDFDIWESRGERSIREAKAREIELEAEARYQREIALLRAAGHAPEPAETGPDLLPWLLVAIAGGAVGFAWVQTLRADRSEYRIRELEQRLYIAERRDALPDLRETMFRAFKGMDR